MTSTDAAGRPAGERKFGAVLEAILEASPDGVLLVDECDLIAAHNQRLFELFAIDSEALTPSGTSEISGGPDRPLLAAVLARVKHPAEFLARVETLYADRSLDDECEVELNDGRTLERH